MSNIIYEDADEYDGFDGYDYPGDDGDNDVDEQYNHQPDSLDDCPDGEDVGELADALELNRKLKEVGETETDTRISPSLASTTPFAPTNP